MKELTSKKLDRILIAAAVLGLVCGGVRGLQLNTFDEKNLPTGNGTLDIILWAALALCVAAAFGVWFAVKKAAIAPGESSPGMGERLFSLGGAVFFGLGAALRLAMSYRPFSLWGVLLALICIAVAAAIPVAGNTLGNGASLSRGEKQHFFLKLRFIVFTIYPARFEKTEQFFDLSYHFSQLSLSDFR